MNKNEIYNKAIAEHGIENQLLQTSEELTELLFQLNRYLKYGDKELPAMLEEIADVSIMTEQLFIIYGKAEMEVIKEKKLKRLADRLGMEDK